MSYDEEDEFFLKTSVSVRVRTGGLIESKGGGGEAPDRVWGPKIHSSSTVIEP